MKFDLNKLAESNELLWQWSQYFKIHNNYFLDFAFKLQKNKSIFLNKITKKTLKKKFIDDFEKMFYVKEVENDIMLQYLPMVQNCLNRFKIVSQETRQDAYDIGLQALRGAIWRYRITKHKFLNYAMTGTILAMRGLVSLRQRQDRSNKTVQMFFDAETNSLSRTSKLLVDKKTLEPIDYVANHIDFDITYSAIVSNLNEDERKLVEYKLSDCNYRAAFIKYYKATHGKVITKETFLTIWSKTKKKMWGALQRVKKPDELIGYKKPILR